MTKRNELRRFSSKSIEDLINAGLRMVYDKNCKADGFYYPDLKMVEIKPNPKQYENLVILHEWLHAYEDLILKIGRAHV